MLDPWIIAEILRREDEKRREQEVCIELPLEAPTEHDPKVQPPSEPAEDNHRGVIIIDI